METKVCTRCGQEKPLNEFIKNSRVKSGYAGHCKECQKVANSISRNKTKGEIKFAPELPDETIKELEQYGLLSVPPRLLVLALRHQGYRGELELVIVKKLTV